MLKHFVRYGIALAVAVGTFMILSSSIGNYQNRERALYINNQYVISMAKAGFGSEVIVARIDQSKGIYSVSDGDLLALKKAGISDQVIAHLVRAADVKQESIRDDEASAWVGAVFFSLVGGIFTFFLVGFFIPVVSRSHTELMEA
jgi:hypothetical protein